MPEKQTRKKRGNPFKRGKTWSFLYYIIDSKTGKKKPREKGGYATKKEAEIALAEMTAELVKGTYVTNRTMTVQSYIDHWYYKIQKPRIRANTACGYQNNICNHILPALGHFHLCELTRSDVQQFYNSLVNDKVLKEGTVRYVHRVLNQAMKEAFLDKLISRNPCEGAKFPSKEKFSPKTLSNNEIKTLFKMSKGSICELEIILALSLGLRKGEVLGLRFSDFDFDTNQVHICQQVTLIYDKDSLKMLPPGTSKWGLASVKSYEGNRILGVPETVMEAVKERYSYACQLKKILGMRYNDNDLVCCKDNGEILSPQTLYHRFKKLIRELQIPDIRFHDLRHSYATALINLDIPLNVIKDLLGHADLSTTQVYAKLAIEKKQLLQN